MKKILVLVATATIFSSFAFAEKVMEVGVKGGLLLNAGTKAADEFVGDMVGVSEKMSLGGDVGIFGHFGLVDLGPGALSLQPEVFFSFANGERFEFDSYNFKATIKYNSFDIALLIGYDISVGKLSIRPFLGPKLGIPIGKAKMELELKGGKVTAEYDSKGVTIGMDFGCGIAVPISKFVLGADIRYGIDFNKVQGKLPYDEDMTKTKTMDVLRRGALGINVTAGYRF